jgi:hypothetical protein
MSERPIEPLDRRTLLRRAAIGGAALWATPMMQSVASAQAGASCGPGVLNWDSFATGAIFTNTIIGNTTITLTTVAAGGTDVTPVNRQIQNVNAGGITGKSLRFGMDAETTSFNNGNRQTVTFSFSNPVSNVAFTLIDIDNQLTSGWGDRVWMVTTGFTFTPALTSGATRIIGNGTNTPDVAPTMLNPQGSGRFRNLNTNNNLGDTSNAGNVTIRYAGPISSFSFVYANQVNSGEPQRIDMGDITFTC